MCKPELKMYVRLQDGDQDMNFNVNVELHVQYLKGGKVHAIMFCHALVVQVEL